MSLSLVSGKSALLHGGYIATIKNCAPIVVKHIYSLHTYSDIVVRHLVQYDIYYARNVIVIRRLIQYKVVATELYT